MATRVSDGLVRHEGILWVRITTRKPTTCSLTGEAIPKGSSAYRPVSNGADRMRRVLARAWDKDGIS